MKKSMFYLFSLLIVASMVLAACGGAAATTAAPEPTQPAAQPTEPAVMPTEAPPQPTAAPVEPTQPAAPAVPEVCASDAGGCAVIKPGETIKIGMGAPMTGDNAQFGVDISQGASIAIEDATDFEGFKFELVVEDDGGAPEGGAAVANKFVSDPTIVAIAGHIFSGATAAAMPIYEQANIPMMSPSATNPPLTQQGSKVFNRLVFTDEGQSKFAADYMYNKLGFRKIAVMHDGQAYGQGLAQLTNDAFKALGGEVLAFEAITPGETDYSAPLAAVAAGEGTAAVGWVATTGAMAAAVWVGATSVLGPSPV